MNLAIAMIHINARYCESSSRSSLRDESFPLASSTSNLKFLLLFSRSMYTYL